MCTRPAETFGFESKGSLTPGTDADIVVFDPNKKQHITAENNESIADYTVYEGKEVTGKVDLTMVRGTIVVEDDEVLVEEGHGEYRERISPDWGVEGTGSG
jgi:dihydropyrimidinase